MGDYEGVDQDLGCFSGKAASNLAKAAKVEVGGSGDRRNLAIHRKIGTEDHTKDLD